LPSLLSLKGSKLRSHGFTPLWKFGGYGVGWGLGLKIINGGRGSKRFLFGYAGFGTGLHGMGRRERRLDFLGLQELDFLGLQGWRDGGEIFGEEKLAGWVVFKVAGWVGFKRGPG
jgi:hypothetical protein